MFCKSYDLLYDYVTNSNDPTPGFRHFEATKDKSKHKLLLCNNRIVNIIVTSGFIVNIISNVLIFDIPNSMVTYIAPYSGTALGE